MDEIWLMACKTAGSMLEVVRLVLTAHDEMQVLTGSQVEYGQPLFESLHRGREATVDRDPC